MSERQQSFRDILRSGKFNAIGRAGEVAGQVLDLPQLLPMLIDCLKDTDKGLRSRAAHAMMQVSKQAPALFQPYVDRLINEMGSDPQWELQEQFSKIIVKLNLNPEPAQRVSNQFISYLGGKSAIARACGLQGLHDLATRGDIDHKIYRDQLESALSSPSKALAARARKLAAIV